MSPAQQRLSPSNGSTSLPTWPARRSSPSGCPKAPGQIRESSGLVFLERDSRIVFEDQQVGLSRFCIRGQHSSKLFFRQRAVLRGGAGRRRARGPSWCLAPALSRRAAEARAQAADQERSAEQEAGELTREGWGTREHELGRRRFI